MGDRLGQPFQYTRSERGRDAEEAVEALLKWHKEKYGQNYEYGEDWELWVNWEYSIIGKDPNLIYEYNEDGTPYLPEEVQEEKGEIKYRAPLPGEPGYRRYLIGRIFGKRYACD
jgi:hypothetical protein